MKLNPHKRCGCASCRRGAGTTAGQYVHRATERALRRAARTQLREIAVGIRPVDMFDAWLVSTPPTD